MDKCLIWVTRELIWGISLHLLILGLEMKLVQVEAVLREKAAEIDDCEQEHQTLRHHSDACVNEKKSYQSSIIKCDSRNFQFEELEKLYHKCEERNKEAGCEPLK
jgi:hypothetical protein